MASFDSDPNSERHHPLVLGLGARRRAPKDGNARHAAAPHTRHRGSGQQRSMATPRAAAPQRSSRTHTSLGGKSPIEYELHQAAWTKAA